jgi:hypothetical protein
VKGKDKYTVSTIVFLQTNGTANRMFLIACEGSELVYLVFLQINGTAKSMFLTALIPCVHSSSF